MRKKTLFLMAITLSFSILFSSCGVMFGGSKYYANIRVDNHPDAEIIVNGEKMGTGEVAGTFRRDETLQVRVEKDGCEPKTQNFENTFRTGNFILSLISWGIVGIGIDLGTGASYKPDHKNDPAIERINDKDYFFTIDYSECKEN